MRAVLEIDLNTPQAQQFIEFARTLPYTTIVKETKKKSFEEACKECNAVPLDTFIDELKTSVKEYFEYA